MTIEEMYKSSWENFRNPDNKYFPLGGDAGGYRLNGDSVEYRQTEHNGDFSPNNPYMAQLRVANRQADIDALYELAVKWEADYIALQEQREYDDPRNQVARQRAAGINPDISSGGSLSSGSSAQLGDQDNTSPFGNTYAEQQLELQKEANKWNSVSTIAGVASSIVGIGSGVTQIFDTLVQLPAKRKLANSSARVAEATEQSLIDTTQSASSSALLDNISKSVGIYSSLSQLVSPDISDEDMSTTFANLGIPADSIPQYVSGVREFQNNPHLKSYFEDGKKKQRELEHYNRVYSNEVVGSLIANELESQRLDFSLGIQSKLFKKSVQDYFMTEDNAKLSALSDKVDLQSNISDKSLNISSNALLRKKLEHDTKVFCRQIEDTAKIYNKSVSVCNEILKKASDENRPYTQHERAILDSEYTKQMRIMSLGSQSLAEQYNFLAHTVMNRYQSDALMTDGVLVSNSFRQPEHTFMANTFSFMDVVNGNADANGIASSLINQAINFSSTAITKRIPLAKPK